jgi:hypothetical protein
LRLKKNLNEMFQMCVDFPPTEDLAVAPSANTISTATLCNVSNWFTADVVVMAIDSVRWKNANLSAFNAPKLLHLAM